MAAGAAGKGGMNAQPERSNKPKPPEHPEEQAPLTDEQRAALADSKLQAQYRREHLRQMRARECPGCGDDSLF